MLQDTVYISFDNGVAVAHHMNSPHQGEGKTYGEALLDLAQKLIAAGYEPR